MIAMGKGIAYDKGEINRFHTENIRHLLIGQIVLLLVEIYKISLLKRFIFKENKLLKPTNFYFFF